MLLTNLTKSIHKDMMPHKKTCPIVHVSKVCDTFFFGYELTPNRLIDFNQNLNGDCDEGVHM